MKHRTKRTGKRKPTVKLEPFRNPLALLAIMKKGGAHGKPHKAKRIHEKQQTKREIKDLPYFLIYQLTV